MSEEDTYPAPKHGWTCFHCGETFKAEGNARQHFGAKPDAQPGCMLRVAYGGERSLLWALRKVEDELAQLYLVRGEEDTHLHRELHRLQSRHSDALRNAEEAGYERGLKAQLDARVVVGYLTRDGARHMPLAIYDAWREQRATPVELAQLRPVTWADGQA